MAWTTWRHLHTRSVAGERYMRDGMLLFLVHLFEQWYMADDRRDACA